MRVKGRFVWAEASWRRDGTGRRARTDAAAIAAARRRGSIRIIRLSALSLLSVLSVLSRLPIRLSSALGLLLVLSRRFLPGVGPLGGVFLEPFDLGVQLIKLMPQFAPAVRLARRDIEMRRHPV